ncbi:hypothetical protein CpipJ_CPIJ012287 [Culex quinquefasciatus]|uniref:TIL domain-containing protein n=1 Tax=Culex quinquefasciatus TaxID=7176 RepID=B0WZM8_CULQU|nr:chymotrypsin inhibitor [Culex quinquefasciatus]EDS37542.1 hypothetical protein CpipJ_CPIJ012287 [Culex quinquefasciatus]|eukprot:XP_001862850.1 hypothetical protein CpipJ_CPIJ012287 [Culex quinquefasciatus]
MKLLMFVAFALVALCPLVASRGATSASQCGPTEYFNACASCCEPTCHSRCTTAVCPTACTSACLCKTPYIRDSIGSTRCVTRLAC